MAETGEGDRSLEAKRLERVARLVTLLAHRVRRKFPELALDELVSMGNEAAVHASRTFDEARGVPFEVYAFKRIRGSMLRESAQEVFDPVKKAVRRAVQAQMEFDMTPKSQVDLETALQDTQEKARARAVTWLRDQAAAMLAGALMASQERHEKPQGEAAIAARDAYAKGHAHLAALIPKLPADEQKLFDAVYRKNQTLLETAETLGISKRSVQRLNDKLKQRLALQLRRRGVTEEPPIEGRPEE